MARNDIERAIQDLSASHETGRQDFSYRVRLVTGHLVEGLSAFRFYRQEFEKVRTLIGLVSAKGKAQLKVAADTTRKVGNGALDDVRDHTFHYPSPDPRYKGSTSDAKLGVVLASMTDTGVSVHFDGDSYETSMTFADEAQLGLAMGMPVASVAEALRRAEITRDGALASRSWVDELLDAYLRSVGAERGEAVVTDKSTPEAT